MMFWHIAKREIYDNMTSLRFGFTVILLVLLMVANAVTFLTTSYGGRLEQYMKDTAESRSKLRGNCSPKGQVMRATQPLGVVKTILSTEKIQL